MRSLLRNVLALLPGVALLAALCWFLYFLVRTLVTALATVQSQVAVAIIAAAAAATLSVASLVITKYLESRSTIRQDLRAKKVPVYEHLIRIMFTIIFAEKRGEKPPTQEELVRELAAFTEKILIWGSDDVLRAYSRYRADAVAGRDPVEMIGAQEDLFFAIRKDLGHKNKNLPRGTILRLFVNDLDASKLK